MEKHIRLLDCTLRDGGHVVQGKFGQNVIKNVIEKLVCAGLDIVEVGFLWNEVCDKDTARYYTINDVKKYLPAEHGKTVFSLMADFIDLSHLEPCDGTIEIIRLSFKRHRLDWALNTAKILMDKGYKVFINPVNCNVYSDKQYIEVLEKVNNLHPYGFSIVDTFGAMRINDLSHRYYLVEENLEKDIVIGLHLHENLGLAYSLAQHFTNIVYPTREVVIDGSLLGMGRIPGNLCIEHMIDYMTNQYNRHYEIEPVYDAIDGYIAPIKKEIPDPWGYATPYALSAKYGLHRTYAEYLMKKQRLKTKDIQRILEQVEKSEAENFNEQYIENLYLNYLNVAYEDSSSIEKIKKEFESYKRTVVLAPGRSILSASEKIDKLVDKETCLITVNFKQTFIKAENEYVFLTNSKRYDCIKYDVNDNSLIRTSNLLETVKNAKYTIDYNRVAYFDGKHCDDSTVMLLHLLDEVGIKEIYVAGFDGQVEGELLFYDEVYSKGSKDISNTNIIKNILQKNLSSLNIHYITVSEYMDEK